MKKEYEKPQIYIERFELAQHIASCDFKLNYTDVLSCAAKYEYIDQLLFVESNKSCEVEFEGYCYTNGSMGTATFTS